MRARQLVEQHAEESDLPASNPVARAQIRRVEGLISAFLADEAASARVLLPDPELIEAHFNDDEEARPPALELNGFKLHGSIDRVDVADLPGGGRVGLINDYKLSREVTKGADLEEEGKLQLQLYALALRRLWDIEPIGGVYVPLRGTGDRRPRGFLNKDAADVLEGVDLIGKDARDAEEFEATLDRAAERASKIAGQITAGRVRRDPLGGACPIFCRWQTICRKERGIADPDDLDDEDDEP
jgi:hypothetical protein